MNYLDELNDPQKEAVKQTEGPVMVIAGAGSGKTRVLTYRIAYLMQKGVDPFNILALTFTNKAAKEMKERIAKIVGHSEAKSLWMGTFHSIFAKILRFEAEKIGYPSNFTIYDTDDSKSLLKSIIKEMNLDDKIYKPNAILSRISNAKNNLISAAEYNKNADIVAEDRAAGKPKTGEIFTAYQLRAYRAGAMDFDDLLFNTNLLLRDFPEVLFKYQEKFRYIMVDEYQDTNFSQYLIIKKLAARFENICIVGDDAQSIYAFRGANIQNILNFQKDYPDVKVFKLEQNYRSTKNIVNAANSVILKNKAQIQKEVWTDNDSGGKIKVLRSPSDNEEGMQVARIIYDIKMNEKAANADFALLYRTNAQSRSLEEALRKLNIPYRIYGGLSFYKRKEIKDLLAYFRLAVNPNDEEALKRIINYPTRGIGQTSIDKMIGAASEGGVSLWDALTEPVKYQVGITTSVRNKIQEFASMIRGFSSAAKGENAYDIASRIAASSGLLKELYNDKSPEGVSRYENIQELLNGIKEFAELQIEQGEPATLDVYMQDIALLTGDEEKEKDDKNTVSLMTIHSAKGLEFPYVFIVGLEENLFPSQMSLYSRDDLEEERRLFYVALTRAEKQAFLSYAISRYRWGNLIHCEPSRFIEEIDSGFLELPPPTPMEKMASIHGFDEPVFSRSPARPSGPTTRQSPPAPQGPRNLTKVDNKIASRPVASEIPRLEEGTKVYHERFGTGVVEKMEGTYPEQKATVKFEGAGVKQLLLKFARIKVIN